MVKTRRMHKISSQKKQIYRSRVKSSRCRKLGRSVCSKRKNCKMANGTKRKFCRKLKNKHT